MGFAVIGTIEELDKNGLVERGMLIGRQLGISLSLDIE